MRLSLRPLQLAQNSLGVFLDLWSEWRAAHAREHFIDGAIGPIPPNLDGPSRPLSAFREFNRQTPAFFRDDPAQYPFQFAWRNTQADESALKHIPRHAAPAIDVCHTGV